MALYRQHLPARESAAIDAWLSQFYPFQLRWMLERAKRAASVKARQIGWSHTTAGNAVLWGAFHGEMTTIVSKGEKESQEVLDKAKRHARVLEALGSRFARLVRQNDTELYFASGGRILALPSSGGRGYTGNLILDEFAYQEHAQKVWDAAVPAMRLGNFRLRVISTPNGVGNEYANLIEGIRAGRIPGYCLHEVTIDDAIADGFPVDIQECWADAKGDPRLFDQLYKCKFLDGELQYIPGELISIAAKADFEAKEPGTYFAGLDIGKTVDRTVLLVCKKIGGIVFVVYVESCKRTDSDGLDEMVARAFKRFSLRRLCVDATGLGLFPAEKMQKKHGSSKVEPVVFTLQTKEDMATSLYQAFAERRIRLPQKKFAEDGCKQADVEALRTDVAAIRRIITPAGNVRYDAPHTDQGHADRAWALALANHAAMTAPTYGTAPSGLAGVM